MVEGHRQASAAARSQRKPDRFSIPSQIQRLTREAPQSHDRTDRRRPLRRDRRGRRRRALCPCHSPWRGGSGLPHGQFDPEGHRTFELGLRDWVQAQTGFELGYVEQLYTFGDRGRELPQAQLGDAPRDARLISVGYLALTPERTDISAFDAVWRDWYRFFPWEDHRKGRPALIDAQIAPALLHWAEGGGRAPAAGSTGCVLPSGWMIGRGSRSGRWNATNCCTKPAWRRKPPATAARRRSSSPPRPGRADDLRPPPHSRDRHRAAARQDQIPPRGVRADAGAVHLVRPAESGREPARPPLHKQNFRRALDRSGLVEGIGAFATATGGRPAELFRLRREGLRDGAAVGVQTPRA